MKVVCCDLGLTSFGTGHGSKWTPAAPNLPELSGNPGHGDRERCVSVNSGDFVKTIGLLTGEIDG